MTEPEILFEDEYLIVLDKPSGLLVHPSWIAPRSTPNLTDWLSERYQQTIHTVHRLDRPTSGVIVFAKDKTTAQQMNALFADRQVSKRYLCVVRGYMPDEGMIDHPLKEELDKIADKQTNSDRPAQIALTAYRTLGRVEIPLAVGKYKAARYSLVEVHPHTGRKHQIRRHMKHLSHPIIGDTRHGDGRHNKLFRNELGVERLLLMAWELDFIHPATGEKMRCKAKADSSMAGLLERFGWGDVFE